MLCPWQVMCVIDMLCPWQFMYMTCYVRDMTCYVHDSLCTWQVMSVIWHVMSVTVYVHHMLCPWLVICSNMSSSKRSWRVYPQHPSLPTCTAMFHAKSISPAGVNKWAHDSAVNELSASSHKCQVTLTGGQPITSCDTTRGHMSPICHQTSV